MKFLIHILFFLELLLALVLGGLDLSLSHPLWLPWPVSTKQTQKSTAKKQSRIVRLDTSSSSDLEKRFEDIREKQIGDLDKIRADKPQTSDSNPILFTLPKDYRLIPALKSLTNPEEIGNIFWFQTLIPFPFALRIILLLPPVLWILLVLASVQLKKSSPVLKQFQKALRKKNLLAAMEIWADPKKRYEIIQNMHESLEMEWMGFLLENERIQEGLDWGSMLVFRTPVHVRARKGLCAWLCENGRYFDLKFSSILYSHLEENKNLVPDSMILRKLENLNEALFSPEQTRLKALLKTRLPQDE